MCLLNISKEDKRITLAFMCPFCGKSFSSWNNVHRQHMQMHNGPISCKVCGEAFEDLLAHRDHKRSSPCKYNQCDECGKKFYNLKRFNVHKHIHL